MAVVIIKPAPKLGWPAEELAEAMIWEAKGNQYTYSDTYSQDIFSLPTNCEAVGVGLRIDTAFDDSVHAYIADSDGNALMKLSKSALGDSDNRPFKYLFEPYASGMTLSLYIDVGGATAGAVTPILLYRLNGDSQKWVTSAFR